MGLGQALVLCSPWLALVGEMQRRRLSPCGPVRGPVCGSGACLWQGISALPFRWAFTYFSYVLSAWAFTYANRFMLNGKGKALSLSGWPWMESHLCSEARSVVTPASISENVVLKQRYQIIRKIGHGATSSVFLGHDLELSRPVAVKILHKDFVDSDEVRQRFDNETYVTSRLQHPVWWRYLIGLVPPTAVSVT